MRGEKRLKHEEPKLLEITPNLGLAIVERIPPIQIYHRCGPKIATKYDDSSGMDLYCAATTSISPRGVGTIDTGISVTLSKGHIGIICLSHDLIMDFISLIGGTNMIWGNETKIPILLTVKNDGGRKVLIGKELLIGRLLIVKTIHSQALKIHKIEA